MAGAEEVKTSGFNKAKLKKAIKDWQTAEEARDAIVLGAGADFSTAKDELLDSLELQGIKRSIFKAVMQRIKLLQKAEAVRGRFGEQNLVDQYDSILIAAGLIDPNDGGESQSEKMSSEDGDSERAPEAGAEAGATAH